MRKQRTLLLILFSLIFITCRKDEPLDITPQNSLVRINNILVTNDGASLSSRLVLKNQLMRVESVENSYLKSSGVNAFPAIDYTKNYVFRLVAEVNPPSYAGSTLQATHVSIHETKAFVSYNTRGDKYLGGIDVFDVSNVSNPVLLSQVIFPEGDISAVAYYNNKLYVVGATGSDTLNFTSPAFLEVLQLNNSYQIVDIDTIIEIGSFAGTDVKVNANHIMVTSGTDGFLSIYDHAYQLIKKSMYPNARSIDVNASGAYLFQSEPGRIVPLSIPDFNATGLYTIDGANTPESKSEISVGSAYIFAALNEGGMKMLHLDGTLKQWLPKPVTPIGEPDENYVTNSVTVNNELILLANGEAGIYVGGIIAQQSDSIAIIGKIKFDVGQSANYVESDTNIIFVATGLGGLKILSIDIDNGLPPVIIPSKPCETLYDRIITMFPERSNNQTSYPALFGDEITKNIITTAETDLYVSFIWEGAGWKNSFGYYAYPANNPPLSVNELQKYIVYPNVSLIGEGGALQTGDMVRLGDKPFPANTVVGFYLVARGWSNGFTSDGVYTHYTNTSLNSEGQQHLLFVEQNCGDLVLTFEDIVVSASDRDFNDIILTITDNKNGLVNTKINLNNIPVK